MSEKKIGMLTEEQRSEIKKNALKFYGADAQYLQIIEELGELIQAMAKVGKDQKTYRNNLIEEIADVWIVLSYLPPIFGIKEEEIVLILDQKLLRLQKRMNKESPIEETTEKSIER